MSATATASSASTRAPSGGWWTSAAAHRWLSLGVGALFSFLAVGGRWDIALAAWAAPILLLRFARGGSWWTSLGLMLIVSVANVLWWAEQLAIPLQPMTIAFAVALGLMFALPYVIDRILITRLGTASRLFAFPVAIVVCEFVVGAVSPMGVSYGLRAITQAENLPLIQVISVTGSYGIAFLIGWFATTVNHVPANPSWAAVRKSAGLFAATLLAVLIGGEMRLAAFQTNASAPHVRIAGITPDMNTQDAAGHMFSSSGLPTMKRAQASADPAKLRAAYAMVQDELFDSTRRAAMAGADIVVWSETAATSLAADKGALLARSALLAREQNIYLNVAIGEPFARNETALIDPRGQPLWSYEKNHPVPGMEPVPPSDSAVPTVLTPFGRLSNVICFDADFPSLTRVDADIMLVPGWDWPEIGWVHTFKMARLRAVENGYALFRQDYNGQSAAFDRLGQVLATQDTTARDRHTMVTDVPVDGARTIYNRVGDVFAWGCVAVLALMLGLGLASRRHP